jgi:hypothetical protein
MIRNRITIVSVFLIIATAMTLTAQAAFAHSFNVALLIPKASVGLRHSNQIYQGFMLATAERDGHPDMESDGHLGGLDVYVSVVDNLAAIQNHVDIVAVFGPGKSVPLIDKPGEGRMIVLPAFGQSPFSRSELPAAKTFISAYRRTYGAKPSAQAAQGYNAARRIDRAVRSQGGIEDGAALRQNFKETAHGFDW